VWVAVAVVILMLGKIIREQVEVVSDGKTILVLLPDNPTLSTLVPAVLPVYQEETVILLMQ
jgi:hypothetical protein